MTNRQVSDKTRNYFRCKWSTSQEENFIFISRKVLGLGVWFWGWDFCILPFLCRVLLAFAPPLPTEQLCPTDPSYSMHQPLLHWSCSSPPGTLSLLVCTLSVPDSHKHQAQHRNNTESNTQLSNRKHQPPDSASAQTVVLNQPFCLHTFTLGLSLH